MDLDQLISFSQIVKTGSFSKASQNVFRSQSAISHQIANLEDELKVKLFERYGNTLLLTWEGEKLYDFVIQFIDDMDNLKHIYEDAREGKRGNLSIAAASVICPYYLNNVIQNFLKLSPNMKFKLFTCSNFYEIQSMVLDGHAHLGIGAWGYPLLSNKLNFIKWRHFDRLMFVNKGHPLSVKKKVTINDIAPYPLMLYKEGSKLRRQVEESLNRENLPYEIVIEMDDPDNLKKYVAMGIGITILSSNAVTPEDKKKFVLINVNNLFDAVDYGVYYRKNKLFTSAMREFLKVFDPDLFNDKQLANLHLVSQQRELRPEVSIGKNLS